MRDELRFDGVSSLCLQQSGRAISLTGTLAETDLLSILIPPLAQAPMASLRAYLLWTWTNNANNKLLRLYYGSSNLYGPTVSVTGFGGHTFWMFQDGPNSQRGLNSYVYTGGSASLFAGNQDASRAQTLRVTGQLTNVADVLTLETHCFELLGFAVP